ncbi:MAG: hypothetical protein ACE5EG_09020 [Thermoanaerobaculia bacterium]
MKKISALALLSLSLLPGLGLAESHGPDTVVQVTEKIEWIYAQTRANTESPADQVSAEGSLEFWSNGGLLNRARPGVAPRDWQSFNLHPKHIEVVSLTEGQVALAMYYLEGSMQPAGYPPVSHYLTRVTEVYVNEDGAWKRRAAHWSAITGGGGTSQSAE